jgi:hypothetical protein
MKRLRPIQISPALARIATLRYKINMMHILNVKGNASYTPKNTVSFQIHAGAKPSSGIRLAMLVSRVSIKIAEFRRLGLIDVFR